MQRKVFVVVSVIFAIAKSATGTVTCLLCDDQSCDSQCTGDYCKLLNTTAPAGFGYTLAKGCYTGELSGPGKTGCYQTKDESGTVNIECFCDTQKCNNDTLIQNSKVIDFGSIDCGPVSIAAGSKSCTGAYCSTTFTMKNGIKMDDIKPCVNTVFPKLLPVDLKLPISPMFCLSQTGPDFIENNFVTSLACTCGSSKCISANDSIIAKLASNSPMKQVTCYQQDCLDGSANCSNYGTCQGDYCYENIMLASNIISTDSGMQRTIGCLNTSLPLKNSQLETKDEAGFLFNVIGLKSRLFTKVTTRICANNYCITKTAAAPSVAGVTSSSLQSTSTLAQQMSTSSTILMTASNHALAISTNSAANTNSASKSDTSMTAQITTKSLITSIPTPSPAEISATTKSKHAGTVAEKVNSAFCNLLNRCPHTEGMKFWSSIHNSSNGDMSKIVKGIATSTEFHDKFISGNGDVANTLYQKLLGRDADQNGHDFWTARIQLLGWKESVERLIESSEYIKKFGTSLVPGNASCDC